MFVFFSFFLQPDKAQPEKTHGTNRLNIDRPKYMFGVHMLALLRKRLLTFMRDKKMWALSVAMPAIFISLGITILEIASTSSDPAVLLTPTVRAANPACALGVHNCIDLCWH